MEEKEEIKEDIEKKRLELYNKLIDTGSEVIESYLKMSMSKIRLLTLVVSLIFGTTALLTYLGIVSGETFVFFVGVLVGYLLAYTLPRLEF